jgi:branched-chain amino acid transport system permease protein
MAIVLAAFLPTFFPSPFYLSLFIVVIVNAVLAMTFIMMLRTGLISLGITAFWGIGAYTSAILVMKLHLSFWLSLPASAIITGIVALGFGYILIGSGSSGLTFVILSSVLGMLFSVVVGSIDAVGGYDGIQNIPPPNPIHIPFLPPIVFDSKVQLFYLALVLLIIIVLIIKAFYAAWTGRAWIAIGLSPRLAESIGVNIFKYKMLSFVLSSAIAGLIGSFYAHYSGFLIPNNFGIWQNITLQINAILGGTGYVILGPLLGSTVMTLLPESMRFASVLAPIVTGAILILLMLFLPGGLLGLLKWRTAVIEKITKVGRRIGSFLSFRKADEA